MPCDVKHFNVAVESGTSSPTLTAPILQFTQTNKANFYLNNYCQRSYLNHCLFTINYLLKLERFSRINSKKDQNRQTRYILLLLILM